MSVEVSRRPQVSNSLTHTSQRLVSPRQAASASISQYNQQANEQSPYFHSNAVVNPKQNLSVSEMKEQYRPIMKEAAAKINAYPAAKYTITIPEIIQDLQNNWSKIKVTDEKIQQHIVKLQNLAIPGLLDRQSCEQVVHGIYYYAQHTNSIFGVSFGKRTNSIKEFLTEIGASIQYNKPKYKNGRAPYCGWSKDGFAEGMGKIAHFGGSGFEGHFKAGEMNGFGKLTYTNGAIYEGHFKDNLRHGFGKHIYKNDNYIGLYEKNETFGFGKSSYENDGIYEGETITLAIKARRAGCNCSRCASRTVLKTQKSGFGTHTNANGDRYEGQFKENLRNGYGIEITSTGERREGMWKEDKLILSQEYVATSPSESQYAFHIAKAEFEAEKHLHEIKKAEWERLNTKYFVETPVEAQVIAG